jgi:hypothetical protein
VTRCESSLGGSRFAYSYVQIPHSLFPPHRNEQRLCVLIKENEPQVRTREPDVDQLSRRRSRAEHGEREQERVVLSAVARAGESRGKVSAIKSKTRYALPLCARNEQRLCVLIKENEPQVRTREPDVDQLSRARACRAICCCSSGRKPREGQRDKVKDAIREGGTRTTRSCSRSPAARESRIGGLSRPVARDFGPPPQ